MHISLVNSMFLVHCCCPHTRTAEAISVSATKLIKIFHLHEKSYFEFLRAKNVQMFA